MKWRKYQLPALAVFAAVLFLVNIWGYDLWPADEPRFAQIAREMMQTGDYLSPQINGRPYTEKPPLLFWLIALVSYPAGDVTEMTARLPSVAAGVATVVLTYLLAARMYGPQIGFWSGTILATSVLFWSEARSVRTDMLLTAFMTAALYAFRRWHESRRKPWLVAFYAAIAAGLLTKGPPALIFPLLFLFVFYWKRRDERRATHWLLGTIAASAVVLAWFIPARMALPESAPTELSVGQEFLRMTVGRLMGESKFQWPWYYLWNVPAGLLPWSLFLPFVIPHIWRGRRDDDRSRMLLCWCVPAFIFFSISLGKRGVYLLPLYPVFAIMTARGVIALMEGEHTVWRRRTAGLWALILLLVGVVPAALALTQYPEMITLGTSLFMLCAVGFAFAVLAGARRGAANLHRVMAVQTGALALLAAVAIFPPLNVFKGASEMCRPLRHLAERQVEYRLYTLGFSREEFIYYAKHFHTAILTGLLPIDAYREMSLADMAKQQRAIRKAIAEGAAAVPVANLEKLTSQELAALQQAVHESIRRAKADPELIPRFEAALTNIVGDFLAEFQQDTPAFLLVPQEDWRWLVALFPDFAHQPVISHQSVGRRNLLLLANQAGAKLVRE